MESETGAKIIIRGKGSVKEGKVGRKDGQPLPGEDEPLHAYVTSTNPEAVKKAVDKIRNIIKEAVDVPEGQNDLRRHQLRELALLNGKWGFLICYVWHQIVIFIFFEKLKYFGIGTFLWLRICKKLANFE